MALTVRVTIGAIQFHGWKGWLPDPSSVGERFVRLGQTGSGSQVTGNSAEPKSCQGWVACSSYPAALAVAIAIESLAWTTSKMVDQWSNSIAKVRVSASACEIQQGKGTIVTGTTAMTHLVSCSLTVEILP